MNECSLASDRILWHITIFREWAELSSSDLADIDIAVPSVPSPSLLKSRAEGGQREKYGCQN